MRFLTCFFAVWASLAGADTLGDPPCIPSVTDLTREIQFTAQQTVPALLRNGFDEDGRALDGVRLTVAVPVAYTPGCDGVYEPVRDVELAADGSLSGIVERTNLSWNSHLHDKPITFLPEDIIDWSYRREGVDQMTYGDFAARRAAQASSEDGSNPRRLSTRPLPDSWN